MLAISQNCDVGYTGSASTRPQIDAQLALQGVCNPKQGVDARWSSAGLQPGDGGLGGSNELCQVGLRQAEVCTALCDLTSDLRKQPASFFARDPAAQAFARFSGRLSAGGGHLGLILPRLLDDA
jgi:hypothetical protein